jgi:hypothetical protein
VRALVNTCTIDAEKTDVVRPASDQNYLEQFSYFAESMPTPDYGRAFRSIRLHGKTPAIAAANEQCYRHDWRAKLRSAGQIKHYPDDLALSRRCGK